MEHFGKKEVKNIYGPDSVLNCSVSLMFSCVSRFVYPGAEGGADTVSNPFLLHWHTRPKTRRTRVRFHSIGVAEAVKFCSAGNLEILHFSENKKVLLLLPIIRLKRRRSFYFALQYGGIPKRQLSTMSTRVAVTIRYTVSCMYQYHLSSLNRF